MIKKNTVFILGAGASVPFGFPTGLYLRREILNILYKPGSDTVIGLPKRDVTLSLLKFLGFNNNEISVFRNEFENSLMYSIDAFLESRPEFLRIGKSVIASTLIPYEREEAIYERIGTKDDNNWLAYLFNRIKPKQMINFTQNRISFVTFNYDRSLEYALHRALISAYGETPENVASVLKEIPIVHLYGQLDCLPWQNKGQGRSYSPETSKEIVQAAANKIRIVSEGLDAEKDHAFIQAYEIMKNSNKIYFLGFGYNEINLKRLKLKRFCTEDRKNHSRKQLIGTALGLEDSMFSSVFNYFEGDIVLVRDDALGLLKKHLFEKIED